MRTNCLLAIVLFLAPYVTTAQSPMTAQGVRQAVVAELRTQRNIDPRTQFVGDSAELAPFVTCENIAAVRRCTLTDSVPVMLVRVTMLRQDSAHVMTGRYRMFSSRCPSGTPIDPPIVAIDANETRTVVYRGGAWVESGRRRRAVC